MNDLGLLILRVFFGGTMLFAHGWMKLSNYSMFVSQFPDPIGFGPDVALSLAIFAEVFCAGAVVLGLLTRLATIPLMITMAVASFVIHINDPFQKQELSLVFLVAFLVIFISGSGKYSLQHVLGLTTTHRWKTFSFLLK
ncbi:MAG: DoxX family protein [Bdellovibrionales bacterium]|nr:DoxX family protein [Bdellovibrionales bacterium]